MIRINGGKDIPKEIRKIQPIIHLLTLLSSIPRAFPRYPLLRGGFLALLPPIPTARRNSTDPLCAPEKQIS